MASRHPCLLADPETTGLVRHAPSGLGRHPSALNFQETETHMAAQKEDLLIGVESLIKVQDRFTAAAAESDCTGTSAGDDGENRDGLNLPQE